MFSGLGITDRAEQRDGCPRKNNYQYALVQVKMEPLLPRERERDGEQNARLQEDQEKERERERE